MLISLILPGFSLGAYFRQLQFEEDRVDCRRHGCDALGPLGLNWPVAAAPADTMGLGMQCISDDGLPCGSAGAAQDLLDLTHTHCDGPLKNYLRFCTRLSMEIERIDPN